MCRKRWHDWVEGGQEDDAHWFFQQLIADRGLRRKRVMCRERW